MRKIMALVLVLLLLMPQTGACAQEGGWQNILLLGGDARDTEKYDRADTIIILSINRDESQVKMTSVMRDTWVRYAGHSFSGKINEATTYGGPELAVATVNECFGMDIEDYVIVNMEDMIEIVDLLGGVDLKISQEEADRIGMESAGLVHMDGAQALSYCRLRKLDNDYVRVMRQQNMLLAMARHAQDMELEELSQVADAIFGIIDTSLDDEELQDLAMAFMVVDVEEVEQFRIPVDGTFRQYIEDEIWRIDPNFGKNTKLLHEFIYEN